MRNQAWIERNRRKVDELSGGKLAYVYMPDTGHGGLTAFTRYYFAQSDKQGAIIDDRFNAGGQAADYVIEVMNWPLQGWWQPRYGAIYRTPHGRGLRTEGDDCQRIRGFGRFRGEEQEKVKT